MLTDQYVRIVFHNKKNPDNTAFSAEPLSSFYKAYVKRSWPVPRLVLEHAGSKKHTAISVLPDTTGSCFRRLPRTFRLGSVYRTARRPLPNTRYRRRAPSSDRNSQPFRARSLRLREKEPLRFLATRVPIGLTNRRLQLFALPCQKESQSLRSNRRSSGTRPSSESPT